MSTTHPARIPWTWLPSSAAKPAGAVELWRRGVHHGFVRRGRPTGGVDAGERWQSGEALFLPRALVEELRPHAGDIDASARLFDRARAGADFEAALWRRLEGVPGLEPAGSSVDMGDSREIEKVYFDLGRKARNLFAKLSWISTDAHDDSLRIRFSFGSEQLDDWQGDPKRARAADRLAELVFPHCAAAARDRGLRRLLRRCCGIPVRFSERILFNNAPGGGARFHHDAEPDQLGVAYVQLRGATAWLALPRWRLEEISSPRDIGAAGADRWLNSTPGLTRRLVEADAFYLLRAGDVLLLPSPTGPCAAWHSVFALGKRPSLSWSFGIFRA